MNMNLVKLNKVLSTSKILAMQNKQLEKVFKAKKLIESGKTNEGIAILEEVTYKDGGLIFNGVSWPMYLAKVYMKEKKYDDCWKYLNYISLTHIDCLDKIREMQAKISLKENRFNDAIVFILSSLIFKYSGNDKKPNDEEIEKAIKSYVKKAKMEEKTIEIVKLAAIHFSSQDFDELKLRKDYLEIISE